MFLNYSTVPNELESLRKSIRSTEKFMKIVTDVTVMTSKCSESSNMQILK